MLASVAAHADDFATAVDGQTAAASRSTGSEGLLPWVKRSVESNAEVPAPKPISYADDGVSGDFRSESLYLRGAVVGKVWAPSDDGFRSISVKIYTKKDSDGSLQNFIGLLDCTDLRENYSPRYVPITFTGTKTLAMRDGGRAYELSVQVQGGETQVIVRRAGKSGVSGGTIMTTLSRLLIARAQQAADAALVEIGGGQFYVLSQGGAAGSLLFFPRAAIDARDGGGDPMSLRPVAMADVLHVDVDGAAVPVDGEPDLGEIDGIQYHLVRSGSMWDVRSTPAQ